MISQEDRLRIYDAVQSATGDPGLAELVCSFAEAIGIEEAIRCFKLASAELACLDPEEPDSGAVS